MYVCMYVCGVKSMRRKEVKERGKEGWGMDGWMLGGKI